MKTRVRKTGRNLLLPIPKKLADKIGIKENSLVQPLSSYDLDDLLAQITDDNKHGEIDTGENQGNEAQNF